MVAAGCGGRDPAAAQEKPLAIGWGEQSISGPGVAMRRDMRGWLLLAILLATISCTKPPRRIAVPGFARLETNPERPKHAGSEEGEERATAEDALRFFLSKRLSPGETQLPLEKYAAAREHARRMPVFVFGRNGEAPHSLQPRDAGASLQGAWTSLGPGNIGGRTRSILIDPNNPSIIYAGAVTGGVWKTTDGGGTWNPVSDLLPVLNIGAMAMDPTNSKIIYAGTGESYTGFPGQGIFKTTDGAGTWTQLAATTSFTYVNKLIVSPRNPQRVYAATETGVWISVDTGATWTQSLGHLYAGCQDMALRTDTPTDSLFASCSGATAADDYAIWRNQDATVATGWQMAQTTPHMRRTSLAIAPSQQSTVYAMASSVGGDLLAVFRSTAAGDPGTWQTRVANTDSNPINTALLSNPSCTNPPVNQGWYDNVLAVDPVNPNVVWAGGVWLFRSDDGGANWSAILADAIPRAGGIHSDEHVIVFHPRYSGTPPINANQTMFVGNDGGIFRTDNALAPVVQQSANSCPPATPSVTWTNLNTSYAATQFYHGIAYPGGAAYFGGTQDNGVARGTDKGGPGAWKWLVRGDGGSVAVDPGDANSIFFSAAQLALYHSTDNGVDFTTPATNGITENNATFPFIAPLAMSPGNGSEIFLGGTTNLWRSLDAANSWTAAAPVEPQSAVTAAAVSPGDPNSVLFGTRTGRIYRNADALAVDGFTPWPFSQPRTGSVAGIAFDWQNPGVVYATYSTLNSRPGDAHVYKSEDAGITWIAADGIGAGVLPNVPVSRLVVNPYDSSMLFLGTDLGIFVSTDGGNSWQRGASPFPDVITEDLALDNGLQSRWLFAFTYGRGAWRVPLPGAGQVACSYSISPASVTAPGWGGVFPVTVTAPPGCAWIALPGTDTTVAHVQSPAQGIGNGTAWVVSEPWYTDRPIQTLTIAGQPFTIDQQTPAGVSPADEAANAGLLNVPGTAAFVTLPSTSNQSDPIHSCTSSPDFKTVWWAVIPPKDGTLQVQGLGRRTGGAGNYGLVVTAYPSGNVSMAGELGCTTVARDTGVANVYGFLQFPVTAGARYLIEASAMGPSVADAANTSITVTLLPAPTTVSVSPAAAQLSAGGPPQQFTSSVANGPNPSVRWSLSPPIGAISSGGLYTPPRSINAPATVTVTATAFAYPLAKATATITIQPPPSVTIQTDPAGLQFSIDNGPPRRAPASLLLLPGAHTIAVQELQSPNCSGYSYAATATIHHEFVAADAPNYTVTIAGTWPELATTDNGGYVMNAQGYDICIADAANTTKLTWELESYDGATGAMTAHVLAGNVTAGSDTKFSIYYGNPSISTFQGGAPGSAWDTTVYPYAGIWHFGNGTTLNGGDSSGNGNNLANRGATAVPGQIGGAAAFRSSSMSANPSNSLDFTGPVSFSFWDNPTSLPNLIPALSSRTACNTGNWQIYNNVNGGLYFNYWSGGSNTQAFTRTLLPIGVWSHVAITYDGSAARFYIDGSLSDTVSLSGNRNSNDNVFNVGTDSCGGYMDGSLDELRIAKGAWPASLIQTMYNNQFSPSTFATVDGMTALDSPSSPVGTQYVFTGWSDGGDSSHGITVGSSSTTYTASFGTQYQLTIAASPAGAGTVSPASGLFYDAGAGVPITATANAGYTFTGWSGAVASASSLSTMVTMSGAQTVTANFLAAVGETVRGNGR
jgi:uncharacterized repeat protein (TIGR02543 family)